MRQELEDLATAIESCQLPHNFEDLFGSVWDSTNRKFNVQETYIVDFKNSVPENFSTDFGAGIVRLALGFHNSYGGIIVFGVEDRTLTVVGTGPFDIEKFNRVLSDVADLHIECLTKSYTILVGDQNKTIVSVLVPKRRNSRPVKLLKDFGPYSAGKLWIRDRHEAMEATPRHLAMLYSERLAPPDTAGVDALFPVHQSFPPSPATLQHSEILSIVAICSSNFGIGLCLGINPDCTYTVLAVLAKVLWRMNLPAI